MTCCTAYSILYSEIALFRKRFGIGLTYLYTFGLEWPILWPPGILTFLPGTLCGLRTSNHYEIFLPFLVQSPWKIGSLLKLSWIPPAYDCLQTTFVVPYKPSALSCRKYVKWLLSTVVRPHHLRGSMFAELLPSNALKKSVTVLFWW
jgi:hypothetical protein